MLYLSSFLTLAECLHDTSACKFNGFIFLYVPSIYVSILRHLSPESFHKLKPKLSYRISATFGRSSESLITVSIVSLRIQPSLLASHTGRKIEFNDICLKDKSKTNLMSDLFTHQISQM